MEIAISYLKTFFDNYEYKIISKEKDEYLLGLINGPLFPEFDILEPNEQIKLKHDVNLFLFGFQHLELGKEFSYNKNSFHYPIFFYLGNAVDLYQRAQRSQDLEICELAKNQIENFNSQSKEYIWFSEFKLGKINFLIGNLVKDNKMKYYNNAIKAFNKVKKNSPHLPYASNAIGDAYLKKRRYMVNKQYYATRATNSYKEARSIASDKGLDYAPAVNGLGNVYRKLNNYEQAIEQYKEALRIDPGFFYAQYYLGDCYRLQENHHDAEEAYLQALKLNINHPYCYYGLGRNYYELGNRSILPDQKIRYYQKALNFFNDGINLDSKFPRLFREKARVLEKLREYKEAINVYWDAACGFENQGGVYDYSTILTTIEDLEKLVSLEEKLEETDPQDDTPARFIIRETLSERIEERAFDLSDSFEGLFLKEIPDKKNLKNISYLEVLKRWNSYTPIIGENSKGGGYFLQVHGKGIVIDPGYDYIKNFIAQGHRFDEIDMIFVSHSHGDHTADLESIISLLYRFNKKLKTDTIPREIAKERNCSTKIAEKECKYEINHRYIDNKRKKQIDLYVSDGVFKKYESYFRADNECKLCSDPKDKLPAYYVHTVTIMNPEINKVATAIPAFHKDIMANTPPLGFVIDCGNNTVLIYTGDTGWTTRNKILKDIPQAVNLKKEYTDILNSRKYKGKRKILLAHIGGFEKKEKWLVTDGKKSKYFYDYHLGRLGLVELVQTVDPDLCLISEWGEEFRDLRVSVSNAFNRAFKGDYVFLPADIGLKVDLSDHCVRAITKIDYTLGKIIYGRLEPKNVSVSEMRKDNNIYYFHNKMDAISSGVTEKQCLEALIDGFEKVDEFT